jgi:hypothetical protein
VVDDEERNDFPLALMLLETVQNQPTPPRVVAPRAFLSAALRTALGLMALVWGTLTLGLVALCFWPGVAPQHLVEIWVFIILTGFVTIPCIANLWSTWRAVRFGYLAEGKILGFDTTPGADIRLGRAGTRRAAIRVWRDTPARPLMAADPYLTTVLWITSLKRGARVVLLVTPELKVLVPLCPGTIADLAEAGIPAPVEEPA